LQSLVLRRSAVVPGLNREISDCPNPFQSAKDVYC
jgi:hypothetical protein